MSIPKVLIDFDLLKESSQREPEKRLLSAVIIRALCDLSCTNKQEVRRDARQWFESRKKHPFSFLWICQHLKLPPQKILMVLDTTGVLVIDHEVSLSPDNLEKTLSSRLVPEDARDPRTDANVSNASVLLAEFLSEVNQARHLASER